MYTNDISDLQLQGQLTLYVDDTALLFHGEMKEIFDKAQTDLNQITH